MIEAVFKRKFLLYTLLFIFLSYSTMKVADFYGVERETYMIYIYFYVTLFIFYIVLPHDITQI